MELEPKELEGLPLVEELQKPQLVVVHIIELVEIPEAVRHRPVAEQSLLVVVGNSGHNSPMVVVVGTLHGNLDPVGDSRVVVVDSLMVDIGPVLGAVLAVDIDFDRMRVPVLVDRMRLLLPSSN